MTADASLDYAGVLLDGDRRAEGRDALDDVGTYPCDDLDGPPPSVLDRLRARLLTSDDLDHLDPPEWLLDGVLVRNSLAVLYGRPGAGKSFLALDWALSIATGTWWAGRQVKPGRVLYLAGEGAGGLGQRKLAWQRHKNVLAVTGISWLPVAVNLLDVSQADALDALAAELQTPDVKPALVVIDTLARCMVGGDENSAKDVGLAIDRADRVRRVTGAAVLLVHHTTKDGVGIRGSSALEGAADTTLEVRADGPNVIVTTTKQKDAEPADPIRLRRVVVDNSCVLEQSHFGVGLDEDLTKSESHVETVLRDHFGTTGASTGDLREIADIPKSTFYRSLNALLSKGVVVNTGSRARPLYRLVDAETAA